MLKLLNQIKLEQNFATAVNEIVQYIRPWNHIHEKHEV